MFYVYVLSSTIKKYLYVGLTGNLQKRVSQHNSSKEKTTNPYKPFDLIHFETFNTCPEARMREKYLKSGCGKEWIKKIILARVAKR